MFHATKMLGIRVGRKGPSSLRSKSKGMDDVKLGGKGGADTGLGAGALPQQRERLAASSLLPQGAGHEHSGARVNLNLSFVTSGNNLEEVFKQPALNFRS